jgi:arginine-tRNA-protein transferase
MMILDDSPQPENSKDIIASFPYYNIPAPCPYGLDKTAVYRQNYFVGLEDELFAAFLDSGFRRNGNTMYCMACRDCRACLPIRLNPDELRLNRNQRRTWKKNSDLDIDISPLQATSEKLALCEKFFSDRYPVKDNSAISYYTGFFMNNTTSTFELNYRYQEQLLGVAIVDIGAGFLNGVYFYFDPDAGKRSLGTYNILYLNKFCQENKINRFYLGFLLKEVKAMRYKQNFKPHYLLIDDKWQRFPR